MLGSFRRTTDRSAAAPGGHHCLPLFLLEARAVLISFRSARECCIVEIAFIKANSSCLSMMLRQETCKKTRKVPVTPPVVASNTGLENQYLLPVDSKQTGSDLSGHSTQQLLLSPSAGR